MYECEVEKLLNWAVFKSFSYIRKNSYFVEYLKNSAENIYQILLKANEANS